MSNIRNEIYIILNKHRKITLMYIDAIIAAVSYFIPYAVAGVHPFEIMLFKEQILIFTVIYVGTFFVMGMYKNMWRYAGIQDVFQCMKASFVANTLFLLVTLFFEIPSGYYVYMLALPISSFCTMAIRIVYRAIQIIVNRKTYETRHHTNVMLVGAGEAASLLVNELDSNNPDNYLLKCIIDDDKTKIGRDLNGVPVVGDTSKIIEIAARNDIELIIVSIPSFDKENKKRILDICSKTKCKLKIMPEICSLISYDEHKNLAGKIRDIQLEDLLGRDPVTLDCGLAKDCLTAKTLLVTGGGGSIGSELCRQIASYSPKKLIILDEYENNAYEIQQELIRTYGDNLDLEVEIASVRDKNKLSKVFAANNINVVFHAAAHKHVPLMEHNPEEAIKNNIMGTYNTAWMADKYNVNKFVLISTDKAVNPTNIMGATKRACEMIVQSFDRHSNTKFVAVRFGNVLGSNGSVIPLFKQQIKAGGPVTVTHEEITRYFMTIPEAAQLVMKAASIAQGGEIFVLDMGEPVKIKDMAYNMIRMSGLTPDEDIKVVYTGLRPGEKLYEELLINEANRQMKTGIHKIFIEEPTEFNEVQFFDILAQMLIAAKNDETETVIKLLEKAVPTYKRTTNKIISTGNPQNDKSDNLADDVKIYQISRSEAAYKKAAADIAITDGTYNKVKSLNEIEDVKIYLILTTV